MEPLRVKHTYNSGDLITILPGLQYLYRTEGRKSIIMQVIGFRAFYYEGCIHSVKNDSGEDVTMNLQMWNMLKPLLESQEYIERAEIWEGQPFDISFDETRDRKSIPMPSGDIHFWPFFTVPQLQCDLSETWIHFDHLSPKRYSWIQGTILINRTERYQNPYINYYFLKQYQEHLVFTGTTKEHMQFCNNWGLDFPILYVEDFEHLSVAFSDCKFFIGNQSFCWHLADAMKIPRILEVCHQFPNTFPTGANGYGFLYQQALELYVHKLFNS